MSSKFPSYINAITCSLFFPRTTLKHHRRHSMKMTSVVNHTPFAIFLKSHTTTPPKRYHRVSAIIEALGRAKQQHGQVHQKGHYTVPFASQQQLASQGHPLQYLG